MIVAQVVPAMHVTIPLNHATVPMVPVLRVQEETVLIVVPALMPVLAIQEITVALTHAPTALKIVLVLMPAPVVQAIAPVLMPVQVVRKTVQIQVLVLAQMVLQADLNNPAAPALRSR